MVGVNQPYTKDKEAEEHKQINQGTQREVNYLLTNVKQTETSLTKKIQKNAYALRQSIHLVTGKFVFCFINIVLFTTLKQLS